MQQALMTRPGVIEYSDAAPARPGPGEVSIRVRQIGICGSDIHVWHGKHPFTPYPVIQGHEFAGILEEIGPDTTVSCPIGSLVTAMPQIVCDVCNPCRKGRFNICENLKVRGFQADGCGRELFIVPAERLIPLPDSLPLDKAAMVEPVAVAVHACSRAGDLKGKNVVVLGAGTIGNLIAQVAKANGARSVLITDMSGYRLSIARKCGIDYPVDITTRTLKESVYDIFGGEGFDLAFEAAGAESSLASAVAAIEKGGRIMIVGVYGARPVVDMSVVGEHEITLSGSMMYWRDDWTEAVRLLETALSVDALVTRHFTFTQWADAYRYIDANGPESMKIMVDMPT